ncbi:hypothetical protein Nepgr_003049 [Nepenthes gracilis]|uniref:Centromere protein X n=1 Tax=Nepenthes gracilis TaxID=150966 RepID=A0AAD3RYS5_NEPGR|nr:hypothetical protein Nepgr_003049 [Nepenthes gracilis]
MKLVPPKAEAEKKRRINHGVQSSFLRCRSILAFVRLASHGEHFRSGFDTRHFQTRLAEKTSSAEREKNDCADILESEGGAGTSKRNRLTSANANALKLSSNFSGLFVAEAIQRSATIAEAEGLTEIEATHLERILPQLLLDF